MSDTGAATFLELVAGRVGHFALESGHHGTYWLDLDGLFARPAVVAPFVAALAERLRPHRVDAVCGPLLGGAFAALSIAQLLGAEFLYTERRLPGGGDGLFRAKYVLPTSLHASVAGRRIAIVDDVMSAGSALRGTFAELRQHGARMVVAGALLTLGSTGRDFFAAEGIPVESVNRQEYSLYAPTDCPLCARGEPLERPAA